MNIIEKGNDGLPFQVFSGKKYHLYKGEKYYSRGTKRLHIEVYKHINGEIPPGWHVHHIDENPFNNDPANLECLPEFDHLSQHMSKVDKRELRDRMDYARKFASQWHSSAEGIEWHRTHTFVFKTIEKQCACCDKKYTTVAVNERGRSSYAPMLVGLKPEGFPE